MTSYTNTGTDETIVEVTVSGTDSYSGMERGPRLRIYAIQADIGWQLTGLEGRAVEPDDTYW